MVDVSHLIRQWAARAPDRIALSSERGAWTYRELDERISRLATGLAAEGIEKGDRVALMARNCADHYVVLFACARLGAILVTVNFRLMGDEVGVTVDDCEPSLFIHGEEYAELAAEVCGPRAIDTLPLGESSPYDALVDASAPLPPPRDVGLDDPLIIMYTSGTTGRPKGAVLTHGNVLWTSINQIADWRFTAADRSLVTAPLYHVGGLICLSFPCLHVGGRVHVLTGFDPPTLLDAIERTRTSVLFLAPTMLNMLLAQPGIEARDLTSVRLCASGGEALPGVVMDRLVELLGADVTDGYGLTEAASCSALLRSEDIRRKPGSVGRPFLHNAIRVVDEHGDDVAPGAVGEIVQSGPTVMRGYWRRPEATAAAIRGGWLHTGDLGRFDEEGFLYIVDRKDDMIVSGGENVYPAEVEELLYRHPGVFEAAVIGLPSEKWGQEVTAVVVPRPGTELTADDVVEFCRGRIAGYKRPRAVLLADSLPRNASGKVLKRRLRDQHEPADHEEGSRHGL